MLIHNADVIKIRVSLPKGLWAEHTSFVSVLYPAWPLTWISGVAAEGKAPLETDVQSAGLTWGIKMEMCGSCLTLPSPSSGCGTSLVHGRLQVTSPQAAPNLLWALISAPSIVLCVPNQEWQSLPRTPRALWGVVGKVCSQPLPWPGCREAVRVRPTCSCTLRAHPSPQTAWGASSPHSCPLQSRPGSCLHMQTTKQELSNSFFNSKRWLLFSHHLFLWQASEDLEQDPHSIYHFFWWQNLLQICTSEENYEMYQGWAFLVTCLRHIKKIERMKERKKKNPNE